MSKDTVFLRFKGEFYNDLKDDFIRIFLANPKSPQKPKEYKIPKSAVLFYVPGKKSTDDEILITLNEDELKSIGFPKFRKLRTGSKGTGNLPPKSPSVPPKLEYFVEGFILAR